MGSELELELESWSRSRPFFHGSGSSQKERLWLHNTACYIATATQLHSHSYAVTLSRPSCYIAAANQLHSYPSYIATAALATQPQLP